MKPELARHLAVAWYNENKLRTPDGACVFDYCGRGRRSARDLTSPEVDRMSKRDDAGSPVCREREREGAIISLISLSSRLTSLHLNPVAAMNSPWLRPFETK